MVSLTVNVEASDIYLFPSRKAAAADSALTDLGLPDAPSSSTNQGTTNANSAIIYASCELTIPPLDSGFASSSLQQGRRKLKSLTLSLVGRETIAFPSGRFEQNDTVDFEKSIDEILAYPDGLEPGKTYRFERSFFVDHCAAPFQRCKYGRNVVKLVAKATFHGFFAKTQTAEKRVYLVDCHEDTGNEMLWHERSIARHADSIGPYLINTRSNIFTVGGYLRTAFELLSPPKGLRPVACRAFIVQRCTLISRRSRGHEEVVKPERILFLDMSREDIQQSVLRLRSEREGGDAVESTDDDDVLSGPLRFDSLVRLPDDEVVRPSTAVGNRAAIRYEHSIELEFDYVDGEYTNDTSGALLVCDGQKLKRFRVMWPVTLNSCVCRWGSMTLPPYASVDPVQQYRGESGDSKERKAKAKVKTASRSSKSGSSKSGSSSSSSDDSKSSDESSNDTVRPACRDDGGRYACTCTMDLATLLQFERGVLRQQETEMLQIDSGFGERPESWETQCKSEARPSWSSAGSLMSFRGDTPVPTRSPSLDGGSCGNGGTGGTGSDTKAA